MNVAPFLFLGMALSMALVSCSQENTAMPVAPPAPASRNAKIQIHGDAGRGRDIAAKWCAHCHYFADGKANDQVPSFPAIARSALGRPEAMQAFLNAPHAPMPPLQLTNQEIADLVAFIAGLK